MLCKSQNQNVFSTFYFHKLHLLRILLFLLTEMTDLLTLSYILQQVKTLSFHIQGLKKLYLSGGASFSSPAEPPTRGLSTRTSAQVPRRLWGYCGDYSSPPGIKLSFEAVKTIALMRVSMGWWPLRLSAKILAL